METVYPSTRFQVCDQVKKNAGLCIVKQSTDLAFQAFGRQIELNSWIEFRPHWPQVRNWSLVTTKGCQQLPVPDLPFEI
jgi:hypothetical protein